MGIELLTINSMKIIYTFVAATSAQMKNLLADHAAICHFAHEADINSPLSENARFLSTYMDVPSSILPNLMTVTQRESVCSQPFDHINSTNISRTDNEARAEIPDWFESTDLGDGNHRVRFCCEPRAWKDPIDELDRLTSQWAESLWADDEHLVDNVNYIKKRLARDYNKKVKKGFAQTEALEFPIEESSNDCEKAGAFTSIERLVKRAQLQLSQKIGQETSET